MSATAAPTAVAAPSLTFTFKKPVQSRAADASGALRPVYTFAIAAATALSALYDCDSTANPQEFLTHVLLAENPSWLPQFVEAFLQSAKPYFAKPYSSTLVLKHLTHRVVLDDSCAGAEGSVARTYTPTAIVIAQGRFVVEWTVAQESIAIQIPDEDEEEEEVMLTATQKELLGLAPAKATDAANTIVATDLDTNSLPLYSSSEVLDLRTDEQQAFYKRKVKEAHLRAKLAQYKAERALAKYMDKYGDTLSDTSDESGWATSDAGSDSD